ncbi:zinc carboxypeptidase [Niastella caeni]|uniref:Zinc carboxypeptidase n=1 Tax=Niastella caeni TaxID=2569763 RepID=A0A4S8I0G3_9BACT|nr:M14 metallopeptidase family protein [Niastella caeni]THU40649.1 zinc carboxypeptidase [Niastella caeni]
MKKVPVVLALLLITSLALSQVKSPDQFLGYKLGTRYTPHYNIVNYCKQVAEAAPNMVKLEQYGTTNEGRPLLLLYVTSPGNMERLEAVRQNNLRLAGMTSDKMAPDEKAPAIVWLSYNVHGNETSSSEAAMLTLYELVNPANTKAKEWLQHTVIIIDPCINPDGRDRYVNWFNSVVGIQPNPQPYTREHSEPWPGGRPNHYYFDLNRDWAWQTQVETQQRIVKYNQWLPQVHVDYHEQSYNSPYYFAPAAEPYHEVITGWQREFQTIIGKNNAKYFDQHGWLFFTKERFDLFYPSYGDTYPLYKGAIGMTYEQGGHSRGGAAVINHDGDTLTLWDRLYHHFTTGMSTIEATAQHSNKVVQEFKKYYDKARTAPPGEFKAYVIKADEGKKIVRLKQLLDRNNIKWSDAGNANYTGINYFTGKMATVKTDSNDVVINANQPNANLVKVLFERNSRLSDSVTYDITAWSVPFVYGLTTYGLNTYVTGLTKREASTTTKKSQVKESPVAWLVRWNGLNSVQFLSSILQQKVKVRYAEQPFNIGNEDFDKGTLIITRTSNQSIGASLADIISKAADKADIGYTEVTSSFVDKGFDFGSEKVHSMQAPKIGLLAGDGVSSLGMGEVWHFFDVQIGYPINIIWSNDLTKNTLRELDVLIMPDGNYRFLADRTMNDALKDWVSSGGRLIALESGVAQLSAADWGIKIKKSDDDKSDKEEKKEDYSLLRRYENRERDFIPGFNPGSIYKVELDNSHPLAFGYDDAYYTLKQDNTIYEFFKDMGWNVGVIKKDNQVAGFVGSKLKDKLKDGLLFGVQDMGRGNVIYLADNPLFRSFWENGRLLFSNAVFMVGQ